jgi:hypothetical protein
VSELGANTSKVFLSYSRRDLVAAEAVAGLLRDRGFTVLRDLDDILPTEAWRERLGQLIEEADTVVFLLSPASAVSRVCAWEVEYANELHKKIAPIVVADVAGNDIPPLLSRLNYIFATDSGRIENAVETLCDALSGSAEWAREHTRLTNKALRYADQGRPRSELLNENELSKAEDWLAKKPNDLPGVSPLVDGFIRESRQQRHIMDKYREAKLSAIDAIVGPIIIARILEIEGQIASRSWSSKTMELKAEIEVLKNIIEPSGRWHSSPAQYLKTLDSRSDYGELFQYPCCGKYAVMENRTVPMQFRADGCLRDPSLPREDDHQAWVLQRPKLISEPISYEADIAPRIPEMIDKHLRECEGVASMMLSIEIGPDGSPMHIDVRRTSGHSKIDETAMELVRKLYRYEPALDGRRNAVTCREIERIYLPVKVMPGKTRAIQNLESLMQPLEDY